MFVWFFCVFFSFLCGNIALYELAAVEVMKQAETEMHWEEKS